MTVTPVPVVMIAITLLIACIYCASLNVSLSLKITDEYSRHSNILYTMLCGVEELQYFTFIQEFTGLHISSDNETATELVSNIVLRVYNQNNTLVAASDTVHLDLKSRGGLPFEKQVKIFLTCVLDQSPDGRTVPISEVITLKENGEFLLSLSPLSAENLPIVKDPNLRVEVVYKGLNFPTGITFLGNNDFLTIEKNTGKVLRIFNGSLATPPLLDANVAGNVENGLLGITINPPNPTIANKHDVRPQVFIFYTESHLEEDYFDHENEPVGNRLYRYELIDNKLVNPTLLLDLPGAAWAIHNGGKIILGPDKYLYLVIGDIVGYNTEQKTKAQNYKNGIEPDGRSGILRITQDGKAAERGLLADAYPLNLYYAYGIRSSFGMDFDPLTGNLWDTENGPWYGDEINLVEPRFNSGWDKVQGLWNPTGNYNYYPGNIVNDTQDLFDFDGKGKYSSPEFIWKENVGPTDLKFLNSDKLGEKYVNDLFVGDIKYGNIYHFDLSASRDSLITNNSLTDKIADDLQENEHIIFGQGFGGITDIEVGPDGYLYIVSIDGYVNDQHKGTIFRILPKMMK